MSRIEIYIGALVLHGFVSDDHSRLGEAVERELVRLLTAQGLPLWLRQSGVAAQLDSGSFNIVHGVQPDTVGTQVAQTVYRGLNQ